jgi:hypothetical protein
MYDNYTNSTIQNTLKKVKTDNSSPDVENNFDGSRRAYEHNELLSMFQFSRIWQSENKILEDENSILRKQLNQFSAPKKGFCPEILIN